MATSVLVIRKLYFCRLYIFQNKPNTASAGTIDIPTGIYIYHVFTELENITEWHKQ